MQTKTSKSKILTTLSETEKQNKQKNWQVAIISSGLDCEENNVHISATDLICLKMTNWLLDAVSLKK